MALLLAHYLSMLALGLGGFIFGLIPLKLSTAARKSHPLLLSLLLCLGGGVLLATSLVHMLTEVQEKLQSFAQLYFCAGFFLLYAIDELTHYCLGDSIERSHGHKNQDKRKVSSSHQLLRQEFSPKSGTKYGTILKLPEEGSYRRKSYSGDNFNYGYDFAKSPDAVNCESSVISLTSTSENCCRKHHQQNYHRTSALAAKDSKGIQTEKPTTSATEQPRDNLSGHSQSHHHNHEDVPNPCHVELGEPCAANATGIAGLIVALLIHSILEGASIGVQSDSTQVFLVLAAVSCHKLVLSFCLGIELSSSGYKSFIFVLAILVYSAGSPIGIAIGMSLTSYSDADGFSSVEGPLQALAAGSLLYVAAFEVLPRERFKWQHKDGHKAAGILQLMFVLAGFACITLINILIVSENDYFTREVNATSVVGVTSVTYNIPSNGSAS